MPKISSKWKENFVCVYEKGVVRTVNGSIKGQFCYYRCRAFGVFEYSLKRSCLDLKKNQEENHLLALSLPVFELYVAPF
jgi:hypothetical protein